MKNYSIEKFNKDFNKLGKKYFKSNNYESFLSTLGTYQPISCTDGSRDLIVTSTQFFDISTRNTIVKLLQDIDYVRKDRKWAEYVVIGFITEVMNLFLYEYDNKQFEKKKKEISRRYNVDKNALTSKVARFIINLEKENNRYHIDSYFTRLEILQWKYRDEDYLQECLEADKVSKEDLELIKEFYNI